jgi:hypothetical protein
MAKGRSARRFPARTALVALGVAAGAFLAFAAAMQRAKLHDSTRPFSGSAAGLARPAASAPEIRERERDARQREEECRSALEAVHRAAAAENPIANQGPLRAQLLGRAKGEPVVFLRRPETTDRSRPARQLRLSLERSPDHETFDRVLGKVRRDVKLAREVFLSDGYLYVEQPELAARVAALRLARLFQDSELVIQRGSALLRARRLETGDYEYESGPEAGKPAKLLLFDRVSASGEAALSAPSHASLRRLQAELAFDELEITRITSAGIAVTLDYGGLEVPALLREDERERELQLVCELPGARSAELEQRRSAARLDAELHVRLLATIHEQVDEAIPFDEPKTEDGQQDGHLRPAWRRAYLNGSSSYEFNGDRYSVFDRSGRPRPPQVCIDFVFDTFERASGTWWQPLGAPRQRVLGGLRLEEWTISNPRSVERFIEFARERAEWFDLYEIPLAQRVRFRNRERFFEQVYSNRAHYRKGDVVAILGPRDDERLHYHSFFVVDADPLSGMPTELAANAGRPRIRSWEGEMSNAPLRSIVARVRPRSTWLASFMPPALTGAAASAPTTAEPASNGAPAAVPAPG